jgi:hypothetical protein
MVEAIPNLTQNPAPNHAQLRTMTVAVRVRAMQAAKQAVKRAIQARGQKKLADLAAREITSAAEEYVAEHPELIAEAKETVLRWHAKGASSGREGASRRPMKAPFARSN